MQRLRVITAFFVGIKLYLHRSIPSTAAASSTSATYIYIHIYRKRGRTPGKLVDGTQAPSQ
jgi:hypothetical protein